MKTIKFTRKELHQNLADKYGTYAVNDFLKKCLSLAISNKDFFFDILTDVQSMKYTDEQEVK